MPDLDWSQCPAVESIPGKVSGAWVFRDTRMPVATVIENLEDLSVEEVMEQFDVTREQIVAVLDFVGQSLKASVPTQQTPRLPMLVLSLALLAAGCSSGNGRPVQEVKVVPDASGVQKVEVSIRRNSDGSYWDGSAFSSTTEVFNLASGTTSWSYAFSLAADGSYTVRPRATDNSGNVETPGAGNTFTIVPEMLMRA